ncbi:tail fiber domain-containing protein [Zhongshania sp.]|uniref:tail fiber domain-containing protein n=1 Tax=Zhongshania sp. TaxID=1971902 RepID=UPI00356AAACB
MGLFGGSRPKPDPRIGEAAIKMAELGDQWLDFSKNQFVAGQERQADLDALTKRVTEQQLNASDQSQQWATDDRARYERTALPLRDQIVTEAREWDSPERKARMAGEARADVLANTEMAKQQRQREMASMGLDPRSGRYQGIDRSASLDTALASAGAQNQARRQTESQGQILRQNAASIESGLPSQAMSAQQLGIGAGSAAAGNRRGADSSYFANRGVMSQGFQGAMSGQQGMANTFSNLHQMEMDGYNADTAADAAMVGAIAGGAGTAIGSSKKIKKNKRPVKDALAALNGLPVEAWEYTEGAKREVSGELMPATDGTHIGPYAEDFKKATGKGDGKSIAFQDALGLTMKAIQELDAKLERLAGSKSKPSGAARATA